VKVEYRGESKLKINSINLGDPCIDINLNYRQCNQKDISKCIRMADLNDYACDCSTTAFTGKDCDIHDYCNHTINLVSSIFTNLI